MQYARYTAADTPAGAEAVVKGRSFRALAATVE
jgi:hypothetical protein